MIFTEIKISKEIESSRFYKKNLANLKLRHIFVIQNYKKK